MATVTLKGLFINLASDLSQCLYLPFGGGLQSQPINNVSSVVFADGGSRRVRTPGYQSKLTGSAQAVTSAQRLLLEFDASNGGWLGELVCVRDFRGRKFYGYWDAPSIAEHPYNTECDVQFSLTQVTKSEAV